MGARRRRLRRLRPDLIGAFQVGAGLSAIIDDEFFVVARNYTFDFATTAWGWIHLLLGVLLVVTGVGLFGRAAWAGVAAIFLASLSAVANFFFIPYYPGWAILIIALDVWVIWSLTRPGADRDLDVTEPAGRTIAPR
jgi:hypothetical protein